MALALVPASLVAVRSPVASAEFTGPATEPNVVIVAQFAPGAGHELEAMTVMAALGQSARPAPADRVVLRVPAGQAAAEVARLRAEPGVRYAEISTPVHSTASPDDPCYQVGCMAEGTADPMVTQPYLSTIGAPAAWDVTKGDGVRVAVLDTGVEPNHEDLAAKIWRQTDIICPPGQKVCGDGDPNDDNGHGTHVSGLVAASTDNGLGIASLGWNVMLDDHDRHACLLPLCVDERNPLHPLAVR